MAALTSRRGAATELLAPLLVRVRLRLRANPNPNPNPNPSQSLDATVPIDGSSALFVAAGYGYTEVHSLIPSLRPP